MFVLEVIPLSRTAPPEPLSYRSRTAMAPGTLVEIPLRRQTVLGLVVGSEPVQDAKAMLKTASFALTKSVPKEFGKLPGAYLSAARAIAAYHATTVGSVLAAVLVPVLTEELSRELPRLKKGIGFEEIHCEAPLLERQRTYESAASVNSAGESDTTLIVVPTISEARAYAERFRLHKPLLLTSALTPKKRDAALLKATSVDDAAVSRFIIATPSFAFAPIPSVSRIVIERISAGSYMQPKRPYLDMRRAIIELARARELPVTYGDYPLPLEYRDHPAKPPKEMLTTPVTILDVREAREEGESWQAIPKPVHARIATTLAAGGTVGILAVRRGYAPTVICRDCGTAVTDEYGRTLSLSISNGVRIFRSADGRVIEDIGGKKVLCKNCGSWNLTPLGVGVERIEEELKAAYPDTPILRIDADTLSAKTKRELESHDGARIIVGTELLLPWLSPETPLDLGIIASADSLLGLPFWRSRERFVRVGYMLAERSKELIVITRQPEEPALTALTDPAGSEFWKEESGLRKMLTYPPYGTLIVFHAEGSAVRITEAHDFITKACAPHTIVRLPDRAVGKNVLRATSVLHLPAGAWPDPAISKKLSHLPPFVRLHIDAETLW